MISQAKLAGGSAEASIGTGTYAITREAKLHKVTPTAPSLSATLPDARDASLQTGGVLFVVWNGSGSQSLLLKNAAGTTLETLTANQIAIVGLYSNLTLGGVWFRLVLTKKGP